MGARPRFLLDEAYRDKLDSDAWREHLCRLNRASPSSVKIQTIFSVTIAVACLLTGPILLYLGYFQGKDTVGAGWLALALGWAGAFFIWMAMCSMRAEAVTFRRMASLLVLVEAELTECTA